MAPGSYRGLALVGDRSAGDRDRRIDLFPPDERDDLPQSEFVQITIITGSGRRRASIPARALWGQEPSTVVDIIGAAQDLISAIRLANTRP